MLNTSPLRHKDTEAKVQSHDTSLVTPVDELEGAASKIEFEFEQPFQRVSITGDDTSGVRILEKKKRRVWRVILTFFFFSGALRGSCSCIQILGKCSQVERKLHGKVTPELSQCYLPLPLCSGQRSGHFAEGDSSR